LIFLKKNLNYSVNQKRACVNPQHPEMSVRKQCALLDLASSSYYHQRLEEADELTLTLMNLIDEEYTRHPFLGTRRMLHYLKRAGYPVNRKRVQNLYCRMGIEGIHPKKNISKANKENIIYPYLLRGKIITHCNYVWSTDITYIRLKKGFVYLMAIIDWYSRFVLGWKINTTLEADFCVELLKDVLQSSKEYCDIFNTDQGCQFTSNSFTKILKNSDIKISMDGQGRALDNIFVERLWRSVKYECIYLKEFDTVSSVNNALEEYFDYYNHRRLHQSLGYRPPAEIYL